MHRLSRFAQVMKGLPRDSFQGIVDQNRADRYKKKFRCWDHLVVMVYSQLGGVGSLRSLERGFNQHCNHHYHLGTKEVHRSTIADANERRDPRVFEEVLRLLMARAHPCIRKQRKELLYLIDSTTITLYGRGSGWAKGSATRTQGVKVHVQLESGSQIPVHQTITAANVNDETEGSKLEPEPSATYVFDKGYCNYAWWYRIDAAGARFITRLKKNAAFKTEAANPVACDAPHIVSDTIIRLANKSNRGGHKNQYTKALRRIEVARANDDNLVLVTNDQQATASEIAALYKQRWEIELFFKWIKQHLKIKSFLGESENAIRIQLLTALIAYLLVAILKMTKALTHSLWHILDELRNGLFQRLGEEVTRWRRRREHEEAIRRVQPGLFP